MSDYVPDRWVVIQVVSEKGKLYRVFASWYGGFAGSDSWQVNSGIVGVDETKKKVTFHGFSGSSYHCNKDAYGTNMYGSSVLNNFIDKGKEQETIITVLPENTNWKELDYDTMPSI